MEYKHYKKEEKYMELLSSIPIKLYFSSKTIMVLKIKYYLDTNQYDQIKELIEQLRKSNIKMKDLVSILLSVYAYYLDFGHRNDALEIYHFLIGHIEEESNQELYGELNELKAIYIDYDRNYISVLEKRIEKTKVLSEVVILYFRLAKLYEFIGDVDQSKLLLQRAKNFSKSPEQMKQLERLIGT
jgi:tetratricopeptide (TPR) repeat protein